MNKQKPSRLASVLKLFTAHRLLQNRRATLFTVREKGYLCIFKGSSYRFPEERPWNSNSPVQYPVRHFQSNNINATSPANTQHVTHTFSAVQKDWLTLKLEATRTFEASGTASHTISTEQSVRIRNNADRTTSFLTVHLSWRNYFSPAGRKIFTFDVWDFLKICLEKFKLI